MLLSRACSAIDEEFGVQISLREIAEELPSIAKLAEFIETALPETDQTAPPAATQVREEMDAEPATDISLPITDAQREVWLASLIDDDVSRTYNEARLMRLTGSLDVDVLRRCAAVYRRSARCLTLNHRS